MGKTSPARAAERPPGRQGVRGQTGANHAESARFEHTAMGLDAGGKPVVPMLQDSLGDDGKPSGAARRLFELLDTTLVIPARRRRRHGPRYEATRA